VVRVESVGICGTDLSIHSGKIPVDYPRVMGHEIVGTVGAFARAIEMVRIGGRILAYGTMTDTSGEVPFYELYHKEISVIGARSARVEDFPMAIDAVASGRVELGTLVSGRFPIDDVEDAIQAAGAPGALKVFVDV
jgi:L-iditol 2-dehydrogenase